MTSTTRPWIDYLYPLSFIEGWSFLNIVVVVLNRRPHCPVSNKLHDAPTTSKVMDEKSVCNWPAMDMGALPILVQKRL